LHNNPGLNGSLPSSWADLFHLQSLDLRHNAGITGTVSEEVFALTNPGKLSNFNIQGTLLNFQTPTKTRNCSDGLQLYLPYLYRNRSNNLNQVTNVTCSHVKMAATIPRSIGLYTGLTHLDLVETFTKGSLPTQIGLLTQLAELRLHHHFKFINKLPPELGNGLTGSLPSDLSRLSALRLLHLNGNVEITGTLPAQWSRMNALTALMLNDLSSLTGTLPSQWGSMSALKFLFASDNRGLLGSLPPRWRSMTNLESLFLSGAYMTGPLPSAWGEMSALVSL
jgi:hypothetical protein